MKNLETSVIEPTPLSGQHLLLDKTLRDPKPMPLIVEPQYSLLVQIERGPPEALITDNSPHRESKL